MMARTSKRQVFGTPVTIVGLVLVAVIVFLAVFAPVIWGGQASAVNVANMLQPPSWTHWAGTDGLGRDLFVRVLVATRLTMRLTLEATVIGVVIGFLLGCAPYLLGGVFRGVLGGAVTWLIGILVAFPGLLLALFFAIIFGAGADSAAMALGLASAPSFARLCQTLTAGIVARDYVAAAQIAGLGRFRILLRHILPNIGEPLAVNATIGAGSVLLSFAGLSFLGLGVQSPQYDWGRLLMECLQSIYVHPVASLTPGIFVVIAGLAFNLAGESVAHALGITSLGDLGMRGKARRAFLGDLSIREKDRQALQPDGEDVDTPVSSESNAVLSVRNLHVAFPVGDHEVEPVRGISFDVAPGEAVGVVGESGCGKSLTALAVADLIEEPGRVSADRLSFMGSDRYAEDKANRSSGQARRHLLGTSLAMVFQDPMTSLNPTMKVGTQLAELGRVHGGMGRRAALLRAIDRLAAVKIDEPGQRAHQYPHEFSGGMRQRAMIGLGLMLTPKLIIADEATTALDVTVQRQVLDLLADIRREDGTALLLISHDISVIRQVCERVLVMYAGRIVESLPIDALSRASHPYTRLLIAAVPTMQSDVDAPLPTIVGRPPEPGESTGCVFAPRCPLASPRCLEEEPSLVDWADGQVACWHAGEPIEVAA